MEENKIIYIECENCGLTAHKKTVYYSRISYKCLECGKVIVEEK